MGQGARRSMTPPALSVVVVADAFATIRRTVRHLRAQTIAGRIELVIVSGPGVELPVGGEELAGFARVTAVAVDDIRSLSWARAPGIRAASAPLVALAESHCYPEPEWAESLLAAHEGPWAAVGPAVYNANPETLVSWTNLVLDYGPWLGPTDGGELGDLPGHNSSYKRDVLLTYGDRLESMLEAETIMHVDMRRRGLRLYQEPAARVEHLNVTRTSSWIGERFQTGRRFGAARSHRWSPLGRALYAAGSPLIPLVRLPRVLRDLDRIGERRRFRGLRLAPLLLALAVSAAGELVGYASGSGRSMWELARIELHKERHVNDRERLEQLA
jgi:hypothetical protein